MSWMDGLAYLLNELAYLADQSPLSPTWLLWGASACIGTLPQAVGGLHHTLQIGLSYL